VAEISPSRDANRIDAKPLNLLIQKFMQLLKARSAAEEIVLRRASYRLFLSVYLPNRAWIAGTPECHARLSDQCNRVRWLIAPQISIPERFMKAETIDIAFAILSWRTPQLQHIADLILSL
jgi:hypothetical protein